MNRVWLISGEGKSDYPAGDGDETLPAYVATTVRFLPPRLRPM
jgi:hypothetical protein